MKISDDLVQRVKERMNVFKLTHINKYKFPANLTNIAMNPDGFFVPQRAYEWEYYLQFVCPKCHFVFLINLIFKFLILKFCFYLNMKNKIQIIDYHFHV